MGEYINLNGREIKLGTCESLYYVRYDDLKNGHCTPLNSNAEKSEYLDPKNGFRFRFPFPDEDGTPPGDYEPFERGLLIRLDTHNAPHLWHIEEWDGAHHEICHNLNYHGAASVNVFTPCPLSATPPAHMSTDGPTHAVVLSQQRPQYNPETKTVELWAVIECPYCGAKVRIDRKEGAELAACAKVMGELSSGHSTSFWFEVARRILAGYAQPDIDDLVSEHVRQFDSYRPDEDPDEL